jgi:hypothetical protein
VDQPPNDDNYTAEIFAMVRDNGRILDDFKCVIGGTDILEADFMQSRQALQQPGHRSSHHPDAEVDARPGSSEGACSPVLGRTGLRVSEDHGGPGERSGGVGCLLGCQAKLVILLHGLPAAAAILNGKPSYKR